MKTTERKPLEEMIAVKLVHRYRDPAEWVGELRDGRVIYIVANKTKLQICIAPTINEALRKAMDGNGETAYHRRGVSNLDTDAMLDVTGLNLGAGVNVNERVPGDLF